MNILREYIGRIMKKCAFTIFFLFPILILLTNQKSVIGSKSSSLKIDSVSVNKANGNVLIGWTLETTLTEGFIEIHRMLDGGQYWPITQLPLHDTFYLDNGVNANQKPQTYYIVARHTNGNSFAISRVHKTSFLDEPILNVCEKSFTLSWDNYLVTTSAGQPQPLPSPFNITRIYTNSNETGWVQSAELNIENESTEISLPESGRYCFYLESMNTYTGITSSSNISCSDAEILSDPDFSYIKTINVITLNSVEISLYADNTIPQPSYVFYRSDSGQCLAPIDTISSGSETISFTDNDVNVFSYVYSYLVEVLDSCMTSTIFSNYSNPVSLMHEQYSFYETKLAWTPFIGWEQEVEQYRIYRQTPGETSFSYLSSVSGNTTQYIDVLSFEELQGRGNITLYFVEAVENDGNIFGFKETAKSNIVQVERKQEVFIPSAFNPNSNIEKNRIFKPEFGLLIPDDYELIIINRWGSVTFSTNDYLSGWNGTHKSYIAEPGPYSYRIQWKNQDGETFIKKGIINLVK